jgi:hypothetical protein
MVSEAVRLFFLAMALSRRASEARLGEPFLAEPLLVLLAPSRLVGFGLRELLLRLSLRVVICQMELNGALSNPFATDKILLIRLNELRQILLQSALHAPFRPRPRPAWPRRSPVLETVTRVLEQAGRPMRASEIHHAACELHGEPLRWPSVKDALAAYSRGGDRRFHRLRRGVYRLASEGATATDS